MNELKVFTNQEFGQIRTITENGLTLFCGSDVAKALGYKNPSKALSDHCKGVTKRYTLTDGGKQEMNFIPEGDIYRLAAKSELPGADAFERWIFDEVLPSIRATGGYTAQKDAPSDDIKKITAEAKLNNSRARVSSMWMKIAAAVPVPEYQQICAHYASAALAGKEVLPLPKVKEHTYSAEEVGKMLGVSAWTVGHTANTNNLKTDEYGVEVWDKSRHSSKEVQSWRYTQKGIDRIREILSR